MLNSNSFSNLIFFTFMILGYFINVLKLGDIDIPSTFAPFELPYWVIKTYLVENPKTILSTQWKRRYKCRPRKIHFSVHIDFWSHHFDLFNLILTNPKHPPTTIKNFIRLIFFQLQHTANNQKRLHSQAKNRQRHKECKKWLWFHKAIDLKTKKIMQHGIKGTGNPS